MKITFKRIGAFLIDCVILFFALTLINIFIPSFGDTEKLNNKLLESTEQYMNGDISSDKFLEESNDLSYEISKATYLSSIAGIVIYILYFVVYQAYNNGQTLGKKLVKIRVLKQDGSAPDMNCLVRRCLIPYGILINLISVILLLFISKDLYLNISGVLSNIHMFVIFLSIIMMFTKGRGIQDYLAGTKVEEV